MMAFLIVTLFEKSSIWTTPYDIWR